MASLYGPRQPIRALQVRSCRSASAFAPDLICAGL